MRPARGSGADDDTVVLMKWTFPKPTPPVSDPPQDSPADRAERLRTVLHGVGEALITLGVVVLLFVVYEVYVTDLVSAGKQRDATATLDDRWGLPGELGTGGGRTEKIRPALGEGFAKLYIPAFGSDFVFTILEGTTDSILEIGPGHYADTAYPGEPGNFSVAGHRVGKGAPFNDLGLLRSCDALVVETRQSWAVYRVLPMASEVADWKQGRGASDRCAGVGPLGGPYQQVIGRHIVRPSQSEVIRPVPGRASLSLDDVPAQQRVALITLTTCHPQFSNKERMILHGVLVKQYPKDPAKADSRPPELTEN